MWSAQQRIPSSVTEDKPVTETLASVETKCVKIISSVISNSQRTQPALNVEKTTTAKISKFAMTKVPVNVEMNSVELELSVVLKTSMESVWSVELTILLLVRTSKFVEMRIYVSVLTRTAHQ